MPARLPVDGLDSSPVSASSIFLSGFSSPTPIKYSAVLIQPIFRSPSLVPPLFPLQPPSPSFRFDQCFLRMVRVSNASFSLASLASCSRMGVR